MSAPALSTGVAAHEAAGDPGAALDPMAQNRWTLRFIDAETEREYFARQWGARRRLLRVAVPSAAAVAAATVLWTVRYPEQRAGDVLLPIQDMPRLAWVAAGVTVAAACLLAVLLSDTCHKAARLSMTEDQNGSTSTGIDESSHDESPSSHQQEELAAPERASAKNSFCHRLFKTCHGHLEPLLSLVVVMLCFVYSVACVESGDAGGNPEVHALVLLAAFAASFLFLVGSATAVAPTVAAVAAQHSLLLWARATGGSRWLSPHTAAAAAACLPSRHDACVLTPSQAGAHTPPLLTST